MRYVRLTVVLFAACTGQITGPGSTGTGAASPDASSGGGGGGGGGALDAATGDAGGLACRNKATSPGSGHHNPGEDCQGPCHNHGFTLAGTLFGAGGTAALAGATITVVDHAGKMLDIVTQTNGNFYTSQPLAFPVTVSASECPDVAPMITPVSAAMDGCNQGGCHVTGGQGRMHLP